MPIRAICLAAAEEYLLDHHQLPAQPAFALLAGDPGCHASPALKALHLIAVIVVAECGI
jgi:hypothetical protein